MLSPLISIRYVRDMKRNMARMLLSQKVLNTVKRFFLGFIFITFCFIVDDIVEIRPNFREILATKPPETVQPTVKYEQCKRMPKAPGNTTWPEEEYLNDPEVKNVLDLADPSYSSFCLESSAFIKVGDTIKVKVTLLNGHGKQKSTGGDLVRVYMRENSKCATSRGHVIDHRNGSYTAILTAFWEGQPEVIATIISPREVIATALKRRYVYPPVLMNTAIFQHPAYQSVTEETPCNYDNQVPGYKQLCNFTEDNYGRPWYCGKPSHPRLVCQDWTSVADRYLWSEGYEEQYQSKLSYEIMKLKYTARRIHNNLTVTVHKGSDNKSVHEPAATCDGENFYTSWDLTSPTGFFYNKKWNNRICKSAVTEAKLHRCLQDTRVILVGDSTVRQMFEKIETMVPCKWVTEKWYEGGKHRPAMCVNTTLNFSLNMELHSLPFCTQSTPRHYFKSFKAYLNQVQDDGKVIVVLHTFAHFLNHHSRVFYETLKNMKSGIISLLERNAKARIVIKGPHAYSFSKSDDHAMWMPDIYADIYQNYIYEEFKDLSDRIIYLECLDMTVSSEQWHIHPEDYVVEAILEQMFGRLCGAS